MDLILSDSPKGLPAPSMAATGDQRKLSQYMTPEWAAELLVETFFPNLGKHDLVLEPSCGRGAFLKAIPAEVPAVGVEIDPNLAHIARMNTGREILCGDYRTVEIKKCPTLILGNPPFVAQVFDGFLDRSFDLLPENGSAAFILPAYFFQTSSRVGRWHSRWSLSQNMIPKNLWRGLETPLVFATFVKERVRKLFGFALYLEANDIRALRENFRNLAREGRPRQSVWSALVDDALAACGGAASLETLYACVLPHAPASNKFPRHKIRQTLARGVRSGRYARGENRRWRSVLSS